MPPFMFRTFLNPACFRKSTAFALRTPLLQCATISSAVFSSFTRFGRSPSGISFASGNAADLVFVRLAHVDQHELVAAIDLRFHFHRIDLAFVTPAPVACSWCGIPQNSW